MRFLLEGGDRPTIPEGAIDILLIDHKGKPYQYTNTLEPLETPTPWAVGSGTDYALGAMAVGADAKKAAEAAIKLDVSCGGPLEIYKVKTSP